jgi:glycolate dehydrogenase FAD-binding subunit
LPSVSEVASVQEAAELLRAAAQAGTTVSIGREGGDVVVSTARLGRLLEHEAGDLTCTVEAGIRLSELDRALAPHGQMLALDPPGNPTIGACIAADLSGPRSHRYGGPRDLVLGVTVVLGDGLVANSGGKVVKNVAGYDLGKLFCGSGGRLGLIARASLRLHPRPAVARTLVVPVAEETDARRLLSALDSSRLVASAADLLWPGKLCVLFEGSVRAVEAQLAAARDLLGGEEGDPWAEVLAFQASCRGRIPFAGFLDRPQLVRGASAYVAEPTEVAWSPLAERVRAELDPAGVLV